MARAIPFPGVTLAAVVAPQAAPREREVSHMLARPPP